MCGHGHIFLTQNNGRKPCWFELTHDNWLGFLNRKFINLTKLGYTLVYPIMEMLDVRDNVI